MKNVVWALLVAISFFSVPALAWDVTDVEELYRELMDLKDSQSFKSQGFAPSSLHHDWLQRVQKMARDNESNRGLIVEHGIAIGDLLILGQEYKSSNGEETEYSTYTKERFENAFSAQ